MKKAAEDAPATVEIEKLVYGGEALARLEGQVVLVPFVLPGEAVSVRTQRVKTGLLRGFEPQVLRPSVERVQPRCEYFGSCGGCHYQHASYEFQLQQKRLILRDTLQRVGGIAYDGDIATISGDPWFYRNRIQLHFSEGEAGFHMAGSHDLCAIDHCYISSPVLLDVIAQLRLAVKRPEWPKFLRTLEIFSNEREVQLNIVDSTRPVAARFFDFCSTFMPLLARGPIEYPAAGFTFRISRSSFFQVNRFLVDALVEEVLRDEEGARAVDLYAGVGLFSLPLARRFRELDAVERGASAFRDLEANAASQNVTVRASKTAAEDFLRSLSSAPDLLVADPPRSGLDREATAELLRIKPQRLKLVSCDPATLARDVKKLLAEYQIRRLTLLDLFPQTYHFETVVHLERK
ncbi:MAG: class I SAM-dependent RNA methyltransferase [Acidobacteriaceae bacterium]|nr:class I SAM-dependent RNA methyltransferase [Acidobacteriaceae bacterium]